MWREKDYEDIKNESRRNLLELKKEPTSYLDLLTIVEHPAFIAFYDDLLAEGLRQTCLAVALGIPVSVSTMMQIGIVGFAAGLFSFLPMGLGAYDAVVILLLSGSDVTPGQLVGLLAGNRFGLIAFSGLLGTVGAFQLGLRPAHVKDLRDLIQRRKSEPPLGPSEI